MRFHGRASAGQHLWSSAEADAKALSRFLEALASVLGRRLDFRPGIRITLVYKGHRVAVVVPAFNEESLILGVVASVPDFVDHIIVVDDCSTDRTRQVVEEACDPRTTLLMTDRNAGVGGATVAGYEKALALDASIVVKMDGDGQMRPEHLYRLLDAIADEGYAYAKGNRFLDPEFLPQMPRHRLIGNIVLTFMTKLATGYWQIFDPQNGYTAINAETLRGLDLSRLHSRFFFENDVLFQLSLRDARVKDLAIPSRYGAEVSSLSAIQSAITFPNLLLRRFFSRVWFKYVIRDFSPVALFLFTGLLLLAWGVTFGAVIWVHSIQTSRAATTGTVMLSVLPVVLGFQLLLQAIVLDIQHSPK
jgi:glycosyltransferase involved in cell wall biosynthesis